MEALKLSITAMRPIWIDPDLPQRIKDSDKFRNKRNDLPFISDKIKGKTAHLIKRGKELFVLILDKTIDKQGVK